MQETELREAITKMTEAIRSLGTHENELIGAQMTGLRSSWANLVRLMAIEPAPAARKCPRCGHPGLSVATRCGFCWLKLQPQG